MKIYFLSCTIEICQDNLPFVSNTVPLHLNEQLCIPRKNHYRAVALSAVIPFLCHSWLRTPRLLPSLRRVTAVASSKRFILFIYFYLLASVCVCVCTHRSTDAHRSQNRISETQELKLQMTVSLMWVLEPNPSKSS